MHQGSSEWPMPLDSFGPTRSTGLANLQPDRSSSEIDGSRLNLQTVREGHPSAVLAAHRQRDTSVRLTQLTRREATPSPTKSESSSDLAFADTEMRWLDESLMSLLARARYDTRGFPLKG